MMTASSRSDAAPGSLLPVVRRARRLLDEHGASLVGKRVLVMCSGGIDSVVLVEVLRQLPRGAAPRELTVLWLDHALRSEISAERRAAEAAAHRAGAVFFERRADRSLALAPGGIEAAAREWRYEQARALAKELECGVVLTGHTASDQIECALMALIGVTGSGDVDAMPVARTLGDGIELVRPLLGATRAQIEEIARDHQLDFVDDPTNSNTDAHVRNAIRHQVVPPLVELHAGAGSAIVRAAERARDVWLVPPALAAALLRAWGADVTLPLRQLHELPVPAQRELVAAWLRAGGLGRDLSSRIVDAVMQLATADEPARDGGLDLSRGVRVRRHGYDLYLEPAPRDEGTLP